MGVALVFIDVLNVVLSILQWTIFIWVILSWILFFARQSKWRWRNRQLFAMLEQLDDIFERMTRPFLRPFRRLLRRVDTAGIDWSPLLLLLMIYVLRSLLAVAARGLYSPGRL